MSHLRIDLPPAGKPKPALAAPCGRTVESVEVLEWKTMALSFVIRKKPLRLVVASRFLLGARMRFVVNACEMFEIQMGINLRGADITVPQKLLHGS
jgi:hypothetical protein